MPWGSQSAWLSRRNALACFAQRFGACPHQSCTGTAGQRQSRSTASGAIPELLSLLTGEVYLLELPLVLKAYDIVIISQLLEAEAIRIQNILCL